VGIATTIFLTFKFTVMGLFGGVFGVAVAAAVLVACVRAQPLPLTVYTDLVSTLAPVAVTEAPSSTSPYDCIALDAQGDLRNGWLTSDGVSVRPAP
jgi:hypothetical protein